MRLFTAIDLPDGFRDDLASTQSSSALDARWTDPDQFHVTLRFIGDADPEDTRRYEEALADVTGPPAHCRPYGLDLLPSRRSPKVLVLGLERTESLMSLYGAVEDTLQSEGIAPEDRKYRPHVTLARLNDTPPESAHTYLRNHDQSSLPAFEADRFILYESTLTQNGADHTPQAIFPLGD